MTTRMRRIAMLVAGGIACLLLLSPWSGTAPASRDARDLVAAYGQLPLTFVENQGQADERVEYLAQGPRHAFWFTPDAVVMSLVKDRGVALALRFLHPNPGVEPEGLDRAPGRVNYLRGDDPGGWQTGVPGYSTVVYRELWPGVDMVLRGQDGALKYEFHVSPGARVADIGLAYDGADGLAVADDGALKVETPLGELRDAPPVSWQEIDGERVPVDSRYVVDGDEYGFEVGPEYRRDRALVIDPGLEYSTLLGGSSHDTAAGVGVDAAGNAYVMGTTQSSDLPTTTGAFDRSFAGGVMDVFVTKLNADGSGLVYSTYLGGTPTPTRRGTGDTIEFARGIAVDAEGHAYITGQTSSGDFPTTSGAFDRSIEIGDNTAVDGFAAKLNLQGSGLVYSTFLGGTDLDDPDGIAIDAAGNAYVTGRTASDNYPATSSFRTTPGTGFDAFVTKLNAAGSALGYSTVFGGSDNEITGDVEVDSAGNAYVAGATRSADFPTTAGAFDTTHNGGDFVDLFDGFVAKLRPDGAAFAYSSFIGGSKIDSAGSIDVDDAGNAYVGGSTLSPEFPTTAGAFDTTRSPDGSDAYVAKFNPEGSGLVYSTFMSGAGASGVLLDADNGVWTTGSARSADAPTTPDAAQPVFGGGATDAHLAKLNASGSALEYATFLGGSNSEGGGDLARDSAGAIYVAGGTVSPDFPTTAGAFDRTFAGDPSIFWGDAFVAKFGDGAAGGGDPEPEPTPPPPSTETAEFSGRVDRNQTRTHTVPVGAAGPVELALDWNDSRADLTLRVRDAAGDIVFSDTGGAKPKTGSFPAAGAGDYRVEVRNTSRRRTSYSLSVTYPVPGSTEPTPEPEPEPQAALASLGLSPASVQGGESSTGTVTLDSAAPSGGALVSLASSNTAAATVPATVGVPAGATSATFTVSTAAVSSDASSTISASYSGVTRTAVLTVTAPPPPAEPQPALLSVAVDPATVVGGESSTGTVTLDSAAPSGGALVELFSSNTAVATVPTSINVPAGSTSATFTVNTNPQQFDASSAISARYAGVMKSVILRVTPAAAEPEPQAALASVGLSPASVQGGESSTGTVTLDSAAPSGGALVSLASSNTAAATVPASINVPAGSTSATFTVNTNAVSSDASSTISASYSGVTRTAVLTVTAPAAATDTVTISRAEYDSDKQELRVEASSSGSSATLRAYVTSTGELIGTLSGGRGEFNWPRNPQNVTVRSSLGGEATRSVTQK